MIRRSKHSQNYTVLPNDIFKDIQDGLAIGILSYLLSKPTDWNVTKAQLYKHFKEGRQRIDKSFALLESLGYIEGRQEKDGASRFSGFQWTVYDVPVNRLSESRQPEKQQLLNTEEQSTDVQNKEVINWNHLLSYFNLTFGKKSRVFPDKAKRGYEARIKEGFTKEDIMVAMVNASKDEYHVSTVPKYKYLTLEFFSRSDKLDKFSSMAEDKPQKYIPTT